MTPVRLKPAAPQSRVKHSTIEPLRSHNIRVLNSLDPDQAPHYVGPDLGQNCFQRLSADDTCRQRVKIFQPEFGTHPSIIAPDRRQ